MMVCVVTIIIDERETRVVGVYAEESDVDEKIEKVKETWVPGSCITFEKEWFEIGE